MKRHQKTYTVPVHSILQKSHQKLHEKINEAVKNMHSVFDAFFVGEKKQNTAKYKYEGALIML